jgi:plastocyanin
MASLRRAFAGGTVATLAAVLLAAPASAAPRTHQVVIERMSFGAMPAGVRAGDTIVWVNRDIVRHSATARGAFDVDLPAKAVGKSKVAKAGVMKVTCKYHSGMTAMLKVGR